AETALQKAIGDRRRILLEADLDRTNGQREPVRQLVERLRDEAESIDDALAALDRQIGEAELRFEAERDARERDQERQKRQEALNAARAVFDRYKEISAELVDALKLLTPCGPTCAATHANIEYLNRELPGGVESAFAEAQSYIVQVTEGTTP